MSELRHRILDSIASERRVLMRSGGSFPAVDASWTPLNEGELANLTSGVRVAADRCAELYWQSKGDFWDYREDFGPLVPPFDSMWIEWSLPKWRRVGGQWSNVSRPSRQAIGVRCETSGDGNRTVTAQTFYSGSFTKWMPLAWGINAVFHVDPDGRYVRHVLHATHADLQDERLVQITGEMLAVGMLAVSLMHCRNVTIETETTSNPRQKSAKRRRRVLHTFETICIPGASINAASQSEARSAVGEPQPLHLVRGHFKTFTDDAPLFGRHTGTYWWGWQARGSDASGVREHDYEVM